MTMRMLARTIAAALLAAAFSAFAQAWPAKPVTFIVPFAPVSLVCELPFVLMASPSFAPNSIKELVAFAKVKPGAVTFASSGSGGSPHLTAEIFQLATGTKMTHVPYKGDGPAMIDLMAGHVNLLFASVLEGSGHIKAGKLKGLPVSHEKRSPALPEVPTLAEAGVRDAESGSWIALLAPAGTLAAVVEKAAADVKEAVAVPEVRDKLIGQGAVPQASTPKELQALIDADLRRYVLLGVCCLVALLAVYGWGVWRAWQEAEAAKRPGPSPA